MPDRATTPPCSPVPACRPGPAPRRRSDRTPTSLATARSTALRLLLLGSLLLGGLGGCGGEDAVPGEAGAGAPDPTPGLAAAGERDGSADPLAEGDLRPRAETWAAFLGNLAAGCGAAFPGRLVFEPEGDEMLSGSELLVAHIRGCRADEVQIAFHIEGVAGENGGGEGAGEGGDLGIDSSAGGAARAGGAGGSDPWDRSRTWFLFLGEAGLELRHDHREPDGTESRRTWYGGTALAGGSPTRQDFASPERTAAAGVPVGWRIEIEPGVHYRYGTTYAGEFDWMIEFDLSRPMAELPPPAWGADQAPSRIPGPP